MTPERARRAVAIAAVLVLALVFAASNFVLVDVRLFLLGFEMRLRGLSWCRWGWPSRPACGGGAGGASASG